MKASQSVFVTVLAVLGFAFATGTANAEAGKYREMDLSELKLDIKKLKARRVESVGMVQRSGELLLLKSNSADANPITVSTEKLIDADIKKLKDCGRLCKARVAGQVVPLRGGMGLMAETLIVQKE